MPVLATWSPGDDLLGALAPMGLAAAMETALVVDFAGRSTVALPGRQTLAELVAEGPRRSDLRPSRRGIAVLPNGGIDPADALDVVEALVAGWPAVVVRLAAADQRLPHSATVVPCRPLLPVASGPARRPAVYQRGPWASRAPGPGVVLPRIRPSTARALLEARAPAGDRWIRSWRRVWELPWP